MNAHQGRWEQRWHPLREEWVVYSAHRNVRPWSGEASKLEQMDEPVFDPACYLCPGNRRAHGAINPHYEGVFIFDNDFPVVCGSAPDITVESEAHSPHILRRKAEGIARVVCYDPRHNASLAQLPVSRVAEVFLALREQMVEFRRNPRIQSALVFENRGKIVGVSNPHPHGQIYATNFVFPLIEKELKVASTYLLQCGGNLFRELLDFELSDTVRIIEENERSFAFCPFYARYAYEVMIFPTNQHATLLSMSDEELFDLARTFQRVIRRYDRLFNMPFPYVMSLFQAPLDDEDYSFYHLHLLLQPPLRQPGLQKYLAGPEIGGGAFMADTMPEEKAAELRQTDITDFPELD